MNYLGIHARSQLQNQIPERVLLKTHNFARVMDNAPVEKSKLSCLSLARRACAPSTLVVGTQKVKSFRKTNSILARLLGKCALQLAREGPREVI